MKPGIPNSAAAGGREHRNIRLDILKVVGLSCVVLAHTNAPTSVINARSFDVPLLVMISGVLFAESSGDGQLGFWRYFRKRVLRLLAPTWIFLTFFFFTVLLLVALLGKPYPFSLKQVLSSYALLTGIGYVWIVRVFILVALIAPLLLNLKKRFTEYGFLALLMTAYLSYELLYRMIGPVESAPMATVVDQILFYLIPYGCIFGLGLSLPNLGNRAMALLIGILVLLLGATIFDLHAAGQSLQIIEYKYPPRFYYVAYGIIISLLLYGMTAGIRITNRHAAALITFMSSSSLWVYLWHIFFVYYWNLAAYRLMPLAGNYLVSFAVLLLLPLAATYVQKRSIGRILTATAFGKKHGQLMAPLLLK
jgi:hypothetical protein